MEHNLESNSQVIQSAIKRLTLIRDCTRVFNHTLTIPTLLFTLLTIILFSLYWKYGISSYKYILVSLIGFSTTYLSLRTFMISFNKDLTQELEILINENKKSQNFVNFRGVHSATMAGEVSKNIFANKVAKNMYEDYKNRLISSCTLSSFPLLVGSINYISSL